MVLTSEPYHLCKIHSGRSTPAQSLPVSLLENTMHVLKMSAPMCPPPKCNHKQPSRPWKSAPHPTVSLNRSIFLNLALYPLDSPSPWFTVFGFSCPIYRVNIKCLGSIMWDFLVEWRNTNPWLALHFPHSTLKWEKQFNRRFLILKCCI